MADYSISNGTIMLIPSYSSEELYRIKNKIGNVKKASDITLPNSVVFNVFNFQFKPRKPQYDDFESTQGKFMIEKATDQYEEISFDIQITERMLNSKSGGTFTVDKTKYKVDLRVTASYINQESYSKTGMNCPTEVKEYSDDFVTLRRNFFNNLLNRPHTVISEMFPPQAVMWITDIQQSIEDGSTTVVYSVTMNAAESRS